MRTFRIMGLSFMLAFCAPLKPVSADEQDVEIIIDLPDAENYGYFVCANHGGVTILDGQDILDKKFFTFQIIKQYFYDVESQQVMTHEVEKNIPIIKLKINNNFTYSWGYKTKRILIMPVLLNVNQPQDNAAEDSYVCELHVDLDKESRYLKEVKLNDRYSKYIQEIRLSDKSRCTRITRNQESSIF
ncbi:MAG: hypothetical protein Q8K37_05050 [Alphaproteobacteria bacterium]|nr:hypothetical protein [Alphaproteobacteria bacterium]